MLLLHDCSSYQSLQYHSNSVCMWLYLRCISLSLSNCREVLQEDAHGHLQGLQEDEAYRMKRRRQDNVSLMLDKEGGVLCWGEIT